MKGPIVVLAGAMATYLLIGLIGGSGAKVYAGSRQGCTSCHFTHGAEGPKLIGAATSENLCLSCHSAAGPGPEAGIHPYGPTFSCMKCHTPHVWQQTNYAGNQNLQDVRPYIDTTFKPGELPQPSLPVRFESRGTWAGQPAANSFADDSNNPPFDGICEVCHTQTKYHRYGPVDRTHHDGDTCTRCHWHRKGFAKG